MTASPVLPSAGNGAPRVSLNEWLGLRRHPHPEVVDSLEALPPSLSVLVQQALPDHGAEMKGALLLPPEYYARKMIVWEYVPERVLVFLDHGVLYASAEAPKTQARAMLIDAETLLYLRSSLLLLYGLLELKADCGGQVAEVRLEYNTVIWQALRGPLIDFIAAAGAHPLIEDSDHRSAEVQANAALLKTLPFKFANGLRYYALMPSEPLRAAVFQAAIWEKRALLPRQITPNTLLALTDRKLVIIEEKRASIWHRQPAQGEYGWIFTYIPLDRVIDASVKVDAGRAELTLRLEWGAAQEQRSFILDPTTAEQWERASRASLPRRLQESRTSRSS